MQVLFFIKYIIYNRGTNSNCVLNLSQQLNYLNVWFVEKSGNFVILAEFIRGVRLEDLEDLNVILRLLLYHVGHLFEIIVRVQQIVEDSVKYYGKTSVSVYRLDRAHHTFSIIILPDRLLSDLSHVFSECNLPETKLELLTKIWIPFTSILRFWWTLVACLISTLSWRSPSCRC